MNDPNEGAFGAGLSELGATEGPEQVVARYDEWSNEYDDDVRNWGYTVPEELAARVGSNSGSILDAGCGTGLVGTALRNTLGPEVEIVGVDASPASV